MLVTDARAKLAKEFFTFSKQNHSSLFALSSSDDRDKWSNLFGLSKGTKKKVYFLNHSYSKRIRYIFFTWKRLVSRVTRLGDF